MIKIKKIFVLILITFFTFYSNIVFSQQDPNVNFSTQTIVAEKLKVGFDIDDTLLFSSPNFERAFNSSVEPYSKEFWIMVNKNDRKYSKIKPTVKKIVDRHLKNGDEVYVITAREPYGGEYLKNYISKTFNVPKKNVYFVPNNKTEKIKILELNIYYGDSDSDMRAAIDAGAVPIRILRSKESSYKKSYNVGSFGEEIIENSEW